MVTEVCFDVPVVRSSTGFDATLFASATMAALPLFPLHRTHLNLSFISRNCMILFALRGLTVLRFNFKVELEAAAED